MTERMCPICGEATIEGKVCVAGCGWHDPGSSAMRVELSDMEGYPILALKTEGDEWFYSEHAVDVPAWLVAALREARDAEQEAERALLAWVREHEPGYFKRHLDAFAWVEP